MKGHQLRHLSYPGRQGAGVYRRRSGPPEELTGAVADELRVRVGFLDPIEVRASEDDPHTRSLVGHAAVFDRLSEELGYAGLSFRERIRRGAFRKALDENQDVALLIEHDPRWPLARTRSGTLQLSEDPRGLLTEARVDTRQTYAADLMVAIERRDVDQMSFGFTVGEDEWLERHHDDGTVEIVRDVVLVARLFDVSAVTFPAYPQTDIAARSSALVVAGVEIVAPDGGVYEDALRSLAWRVHRGEVEASGEDRALIDAAYSRTEGVSPWTAQRALRAVALEPELRGADHDGPADDDTITTDAPPEGERPSLAARRARLAELTK